MERWKGQRAAEKSNQRTAETVDKCSVMAINKTIRQKLSYRKNTAFDRKQM
jgi:hypothetical protein